jgi:hypothetical protein
MIKKSGQTALILILLMAAALIFLAITLNWGRIAQTKALVTVAADQSSALLASDAASYGEAQKQTYLNDTNKITEQNGILLFIIMLILAIFVLFVAIAFGGSAFLIGVSALSVGLAAVDLALQLLVVQPMITKMWNDLQKNQPIQQQFYEGGIISALEGSVGDQVNVADYFDSNMNGIWGSTNGVPNDVVSRFALFYTDRLKMINKASPTIPQVVFFYDMLGELMNGETCTQNANDNATYGVPINPGCTIVDNLDGTGQYCINDPIDPACQAKIPPPNGFQLNDACQGSDPGNTATYSPYCDPCCQPLTVNGKAIRPSNCPTDTSANGAPAQCWTNNPYNSSPGSNDSVYTLLYDPTFQNYAAGLSFLDQYGRDQPKGTPPFTLTPDVITPNGVNPVVEFPNGIFPFFWLTDAYSLEVDNINPTVSPPVAGSPALHWCSPATAAVNGVDIPAFTAPTGYSDLAQLGQSPYNLPYTCQGQDCCVNFLADTVGSINGVPTPVSDGTTNGTTNGWIDMVGSPSFGSNPGLDPSFGGIDAGSWLPGDNQLCSTTWPYNGANMNTLDGTCEWTGSTTAPPPPSPPLVEPPSTLDALDDNMHTLSDFVKYSNTFLNNDVGTLSSTFTTWYPQMAVWIAPGGNCDDGSACTNGVCSGDGSPCGTGQGPLLSLPATLNTWNTVITNWLNQTYASPSAWCVPPEATLLGGNQSTTEDTYINSNSGTTTWGDLPHVIACLNYNSNQNPAGGSVYNYQQCKSALSVCPSSLPAACAPSILGRSLAGAAPAYDSCGGNYVGWVNNSLTLATDEAPKFALRSLYLQDVYARAQTMTNIFQAGNRAFSAFFAPCSGSDCSTGGPAAQLTYAYDHNASSPTSTLPNAVIYGWQDNLPSGSAGGCMGPNGNKVGCAHIVKVTAYSPGRGGTFSLPKLPWIQTKTTLLTRSYTLVDRDGYVYVSVKRWDEDHNPINFPNGHTLWQFMFHNSNGVTNTGQSFFQHCSQFPLPGGSTFIGFGLMPETIAGLVYENISTQDQIALSNAFMLDDNGNGNLDPSAKNYADYKVCLNDANALLSNGQESHACVQYIASRDASKPSGNGASDYSMKFVTCPYIPAEDLGTSQGGL